ncbi:MAG: hypothetical protein LC775_06320, partial [Acidobacteria bacterium]|nr:hypothetical protein [Acidobacteriota bacterium]
LDPSGFNLGEVIRELRCFSLVSFDDDLPSTGGEFLTDANRTITTNSIVQDLIRADIERDNNAPLALNSLANHVARWLTALDINLFERASVIFTHANTLVNHIDRLNIRGNHIPLFYGNLALAYRLGGDTSEAEKLLRAELNLLENSAKPNETLAMQTKLSLVGIAFETPGPTSISSTEALTYLEDAFRYAIQVSVEWPLAAVRTAVLVKDLARHPTAQAANPSQFSQLEQKCAQLAAQLGPTPFSQAMDAAEKASDLICEGHPADAEQLCRQALESNLLLGPTELEVRRVLVEALVQQCKWQVARGSFNDFRRYFGSTGFGLWIVARFVHNVGCLCTIPVLKERDQDALKLLGDILDWPIVSEALTQPSSGWSPRLRLLGAVRDLGNGNYRRAELTLRTIRPVELREGTPKETRAWCFLWQMARLATFRATSSVYICDDG